MKNLLIYINPKKEFDKEAEVNAQIQIENSLELGWKPKDIIFVTNFPYKYKGIKARVMKDKDAHCDYCPISTKTTCITKLFEKNLIKKNTLYWAHDLDAYQLEPINENDIPVPKYDMALCNFARRPKWAGGSIFFNYKAKDIFQKVKETMDLHTTVNKTLMVDESALTYLTSNNPKIAKRLYQLNITYNFICYNLASCFRLAEKPIKVIHFHLYKEVNQLGIKNPFDFFNGDNRLDLHLISPRLLKIFASHKIKSNIKPTMKNLMIYINPQKKFWDEKKELVKIQIDNSLNLKWKKKDIVLITNFPYEYKGIKAIVVDDSLFCTVHDKASKINVIIYLLQQGIVKNNELWWFHDFDAYQLHRIKEPEIDLAGTSIGFTDYGWFSKFNTGSIFFTRGSLKIFEWIRNALYKMNTDEERALTALAKNNYKNINNRYVRLNVTYNFPSCLNGERMLPITIKLANKPIKVMHFHPIYKGVNYIKVMSGQNRLRLPLITPRLMKAFKKHLPELCP